MGRKHGVSISPWMSAKTDCKEGRFIQVGNSLLLSEKAKTLSAGARLMYLCMAMESGGKVGFQFPRSSGLKYGFSETTYERYLKELTAAGFIECVSHNKNLRLANDYKFSFGWKQAEGDRPSISG